VQLFLSPLTAGVYAQFREYMQARDQSPPPPPEDGVWVTNADCALVACCALYNAGPIMLAEFAVTSPYAPLRLRHRAAQLVIETMLAKASMAGKVLVTLPATPGMVKMLERYGLRVMTAIVMSAQPGLLPVGGASRAPRPQTKPPEAHAAEGPARNLHNKEAPNLPPTPPKPKKTRKKPAKKKAGVPKGWTKSKPPSPK
jgi:hypothetical protein